MLCLPAFILCNAQTYTLYVRDQETPSTAGALPSTAVVLPVPSALPVSAVAGGQPPAPGQLEPASATELHVKAFIQQQAMAQQFMQQQALIRYTHTSCTTESH